MTKLLAGALGVATGLLFAAFALAAGTYTDAAGDDNAAPDVRSVSVSESPSGTLTVTVAVANYQTLPPNSWFNVWFDLDSNRGTGDAGDEAVIRYLAAGEIELYRWDGSELVERPTADVAGSFAAGALTLSVPRIALDATSGFGILAVGARVQLLGGDELIASDYAPDVGRSAYVGPAQATFSDATGDHDAAPDITSVRVADAKNGWVSFAIATPNYPSLPPGSVLVLAIDADNRHSTGDDGADVLVRSIGGEAASLERWQPASKSWVGDAAPARVRTRSGNGVQSIEVHRSELGTAARLGFAVLSADINTSAGTISAIDSAPDDLAFYAYTYANKAELRLTITRLFGAPAQPRAGKPFTVNLAVRRSDTGRGITSGSVTCRVLVEGKKVAVTGRVTRGGGRCAFVVPASAKGKAVRGSITVRSGGKSVAADFAYVVR